MHSSQLRLALGALVTHVCSSTRRDDGKPKTVSKHTLRRPSSFVASIIFPFVLSAPVMNAFCPVSFPFAMSTKVSSERMIVTSGLRPSDFASPFFTRPNFFKSMVHHASFPSAFLTLNSKTPLFCVTMSGEEHGFKEAHVERAPSSAVLPSHPHCTLQRPQQAQ